MLGEDALALIKRWHLRKVLEATQLFGTFTEPQLQELMGCFRARYYPAGCDVVQQVHPASAAAPPPIGAAPSHSPAPPLAPPL